jgi:hypothetical protein
MKLVASQPVTIISDRVNRKYIPHVANFPSGLLRMSLGIGPDNNFTPNCSYHSHDGGKTWNIVDDLCPRTEWNMVLSDGSYFEIDDYWFQDAKHPGVYHGNGGFSTHEHDLHHEYVVIHAPSTIPKTLRSMRQFGQPQNPWFDLINKANYNDPNASLDSVMLGGTVITAIVESGSPKHLLGVGYELIKGYNKAVVMLYESTDGGREWREKCIALSAEEMPEGCNETALERLASGELYVMARTGSLMIHARSADNGKTWTKPTPVQLVDTREYITGVWPIVRRLKNGGLVATYGRPKSTFTSLEQAAKFDYVAEHYGHCGKFVMIDPTGTGNHWQGRIDLHKLEVELQAHMGVPENDRLRVQEDTNVRDSNSWEYLSVNEVAPDELLITYDVQRFRENWNSHRVQGVRMVRVRVTGR